MIQPGNASAIGVAQLPDAGVDPLALAEKMRVEQEAKKTLAQKEMADLTVAPKGMLPWDMPVFQQAANQYAKKAGERIARNGGVRPNPGTPEYIEDQKDKIALQTLAEGLLTRAKMATPIITDRTGATKYKNYDKAIQYYSKPFDPTNKELPPTLIPRVNVLDNIAKTLKTQPREGAGGVKGGPYGVETTNATWNTPEQVYAAVQASVEESPEQFDEQRTMYEQMAPEQQAQVDQVAADYGISPEAVIYTTPELIKALTPKMERVTNSQYSQAGTGGATGMNEMNKAEFYWRIGRDISAASEGTDAELSNITVDGEALIKSPAGLGSSFSFTNPKTRVKSKQPLGHIYINEKEDWFVPVPLNVTDEADVQEIVNDPANRRPLGSVSVFVKEIAQESEGTDVGYINKVGMEKGYLNDAQGTKTNLDILTEGNYTKRRMQQRQRETVFESKRSSLKSMVSSGKNGAETMSGTIVFGNQAVENPRVEVRLLPDGNVMLTLSDKSGNKISEAPYPKAVATKLLDEMRSGVAPGLGTGSNSAPAQPQPEQKTTPAGKKEVKVKL